MSRKHFQTSPVIYELDGEPGGLDGVIARMRAFAQRIDPGLEEGVEGDANMGAYAGAYGDDRTVSGFDFSDYGMSGFEGAGADYWRDGLSSWSSYVAARPVLQTVNSVEVAGFFEFGTFGDGIQVDGGWGFRSGLAKRTVYAGDEDEALLSGAETTQKINGGPDKTAQTPELTMPGEPLEARYESGTDGLHVALDISAALTDNDGSETLSVRISGLPNGATLSAGTIQKDGRWLLTAEDLDGVTMDLPPGLTDDFQLTIVAEARERVGGAIAVSDGVVTVDVMAWTPPQEPNFVPEPAPEPVPEPEVSTEVPGPFEGGDVLWVGAGQQYADLQAAVDASGVNDTIYIAAGAYDFGEVMIDHTVNIIGVGDVTLTAVDRVYKGALVTKPGVSLYVENLTFEGIHSWDRNGAGIRHQGTDLIVVDSHFNNNENGILGSADGTGDMYIVNSSFIDNGFGDGYSHGIYVKGVNTLFVEGSEFAGTKIGHHVKSMADNTIVRNSLLDDAEGQTSYSIEVSNGGDLVVSGNQIIKAADSDNPTVISYSVNRGGDAGTVLIEGNTISNYYVKGVMFKNSSDAIADVNGNTFINQSGGDMTLADGLANLTSNTLNGIAISDKAYDEGATFGLVGPDVMFGTTGDDIISGLAGDDQIYGGMDETDLGAGRDLLFGGDGNDRIFGGRHSDTLIGEDGDDFLDGGEGDDLVAGNWGADILVGGSGSDKIIGGEGDDLLLPEGGLDIVNGGNGVDTAFFQNSYSAYDLNLDGGRWYVKISSDYEDWGTNKLSNVEYMQFGDGVFVTETGEFHAGVILATYGDVRVGVQFDLVIPEALQTLASETEVVFNPDTETDSPTQEIVVEPDLLLNWSGNSIDLRSDFLARVPTNEGTVLDETLLGTNGEDVFVGNGGKDTFYGGLGDDIYFVDSYNDHGIEEPESGIDTVVSFANWQDLLSNVENLILGGNNNSGGAGNNLNNLLIGNDGSNTLKGMSGNDYIIGGAGQDTLTGGSGSDVFVFDQNSTGQDVLTDFDLSDDHIYLTANMNDNTIDSAEQAVASLYDNENGFATLNLGAGNTITFFGISAVQLTVDDFTVG